MRKTVLAASALGLAALALAGCERAATPPESEQTTTQNATEVEGLEGLKVENPRLILPAVGGNPGVVYFDLVNSSNADYAISRADVEGAGRSEMHASMKMANGEMSMSEAGPQTVKAGGKLSFEPGGYHVMVFDLSPELVAGGKTEVTLTMANGDKMSFDAPIRPAGDER